MEQSKTPGRRPAGAIAQELAQKTPDTRDPILLGREMRKQTRENIWASVTTGIKKFSPRDFFVELFIKRPGYISNTLHERSLPRLSCPTPTYDQTVFKYTYSAGRLDHLWTVPGKEVCEHFIANASVIVTEERIILDAIAQFKDGSLFRLANQLNEKLEQEWVRMGPREKQSMINGNLQTH